MRIAILGAGNIGATLARKLQAAGHAVVLANSREPETIAAVADQAGVKAAFAPDAVKDAQVVIIAIPQGRMPEMREVVKDLPDDVVIIDAGNYYPVRDGRVESIESGQPESLWVAEQLGRPVIKAWNAVLAGTLGERGRPAGAPDRIALPVAGDNPEAKKICFRLMEETGFEPVDGGSLAESWRQQPGAKSYCTELSASDLRKALETTERAGAYARRDRVGQALRAHVGKVTNDVILEANRGVHA